MRAQPITTTLVVALLLAACESPPGPRTGALRLSFTTGGGDLDLDGYGVVLDGGTSQQPVPVNGTVVVPDLPTGAHQVALTGVAGNCTVNGGAFRSVTVTGSDTTNVDFAVACVATGVRITTAATGVDVDADGYAVGLDSVLVAVVGAAGSVEITRLTAGSHRVSLTAVAGNCSVGGENPRSVNIVAREIVPVAFTVSCVAVTGVIEVAATTSGLDLDPDGYTIQVDAGTTRPLPINGAVRVPGVAEGDHSVTFTGGAGNCAVAGANPRTVHVSVGGATRDTARTTFQVGCTATTGVVEVKTATSGVDLDPDGYTVRVDGGAAQSLGVGATIRFPELAGGDHSVALAGAAANCTVGAPNPRTVSVAVGGATRDTARTTFDVNCVSLNGSLHIAVSTSGAEFDPNGYRVLVDEVCDYSGYYYDYCYYLWNLSLGVNGETTITPIPTGDHTIWISDVARNCTVAGANPRTATVPPAATADVVFAVSCAQTGSVQLSAPTTGADPDANGYRVRLHGASLDTTVTVAANATVSVTGLPPGNYGVFYSGVSFNCTVTSPGPGSVTVPSGGSVAASMSVDCGTARQLAFVLNNQIFKMKVNDADPTQVTANPFAPQTPVWSSDGSKIVFTGFPSGNAEIYVINAAGSGQVRLTTNAAADYGPSWSPDGTRIVFVSNRDGNPEIYVMDAAGTNVVRLTNDAAIDADPTWYGTRIAFTSNRAGHAAIYVMDSNGANVTQVTTPVDGDDAKPTWSPDGTRIAFSRGGPCDYYSCERHLYVIDVSASGSGSGLLQLTAGPDDGDPAWSPDGDWIAFTRAYFIRAVRTNGTDVRDIIGNAYNPTWGP